MVRKKLEPDTSIFPVKKDCFFLSHPHSESCSQLDPAVVSCVLPCPASCPALWKPLAASCQPPSGSLRPCSTSPWQDTVIHRGRRRTCWKKWGKDAGRSLVDHGWSWLFSHDMTICWRWHPILECFGHDMTRPCSVRLLEKSLEHLNETQWLLMFPHWCHCHNKLLLAMRTRKIKKGFIGHFKTLLLQPKPRIDIGWWCVFRYQKFSEGTAHHSSDLPTEVRNLFFLPSDFVVFAEKTVLCEVTWQNVMAWGHFLDSEGNPWRISRPW